MCFSSDLRVKRKVSEQLESNIFGLNHYNYKYKRGIDMNRSGFRISLELDDLDFCKCPMIVLFRLHHSKAGHALFAFLNHC